MPAIGNVDSLSQLSPSMEEDTSRGDMREPSTSSLIPGMCRWQSRSKGSRNEKGETSAGDREELPASAILATVNQPSCQGQRLSLGEYEMTMKDSKGPATHPMDPVVDRLFRGSQLLSSRYGDIQGAHDRPADYRLISAPIPGILSAPGLVYDR